MNIEEHHPDVGAAIFEYCHVDPVNPGTRTRCGFRIQFGESPDFQRARCQMHGAEFIGIAHAIFEVGDGGAVWPEDSWHEFSAALYGGNTIFFVKVKARDENDFMVRCREIGGLWMPGIHPTRWWRTMNWLRWHWRRRLTIRRRSPLDCFN